MSLYRKKPVVIEARQLTDASMWDIWDWIGDDADEWCWDDDEKYIVIKTLEGKVKASENDWVICGVNKEFYPCKPDIFDKTYELAAERESAESYKQSLTDLHKVHCATVAELAAERERAEADKTELALRHEIIGYNKGWKDAENRIAKLREALEPFARWCAEMEEYNPTIGDDARVAASITMADARRARAVLRETGGGDGRS